jgi:hypothetical protein
MKALREVAVITRSNDSEQEDFDYLIELLKLSNLDYTIQMYHDEEYGIYLQEDWGGVNE